MYTENIKHSTVQLRATIVAPEHELIDILHCDVIFPPQNLFPLLVMSVSVRLIRSLVNLPSVPGCSI